MPARTLGEIYCHFGETDVGENSPVYRAVACAVGRSEEALRAIEQAPPLKRHPTVILASLHDIVLRGDAPELAEAYTQRDLDRSAELAIDTLIAKIDDVVATATKRQTQTNETGRGAVLYPAVAEAAARTGAAKIGLVDVGCSAGLNLNLDRAGIAYSNGVFLGDAASPLQLTCDVVAQCTVPDRPLPEVVARVGVDLNPVDVSDEEDARWLRACLWPDQPERGERLDAAIELARSSPPTLIRGDALEVLTDAIERVPGDAMPVVTTTWALSYFSLEGRLRFLRRLDEAARNRTVAWVSGEGVGIAPAVPTLGDSRSAAHSLVGLALVDAGALRVDTIGRCHPHGRWLEWLA